MHPKQSTTINYNYVIFQAAPTPPRKAEKEGDETSSGEENSDDDEAPSENPASSEYQVPTTVSERK